MPSYWERRAQEARQRSLAAQASRYSGQASQFDNVSRQVGEATGYGGVSSVVEARARRRREEEAERVRRQNALRLAEEERRRAEEEAAQRAQAEARVAEARRRREAEDAARRPRFALPTGALGPGFQPTVQDYAAAGGLVSDVASEAAFGPERDSWLAGVGAAPKFERTLRDWGLSEQEFRASGSAFDEGRPLAGLGWGALAVAGAVPLFGQAGRGLVKGAGAVGDVVRAAGSAADVERVAGRVGDISADVSRAVVNNPNPVYTLPPEQLAKVPQGREVTAEVFHRQGFDRLPTAVDGNEFSRAASSGDYIALYRGIRGGKNPVRGSVGMADETVDAQRSAEDFIRGDMFYGGGAGPDGSYFATSLDAARGYAVGVNPMMASSEPGAVISALLPRTARIVRHDDPALLAEFSQSGYNNIGAFAAAKGYDAMLHEKGIHIVLNRSALTVSDAPEIYRFGSETAESASDVARAANVTPRPMVFADNIADDFINERFRGTELFSNRKPNIESVPLERRDVAELAYRQGFEAPPRVVDSQTFDLIGRERPVLQRERLPLQHQGAPNESIFYRGFKTEPDINDQFGRFRTAEHYANELAQGEYYVGHGVRGHGTYFSENVREAVSYTGAGTAWPPEQPFQGAIVRARISPDARLLDGFNERTALEFRQSPFNDISEFAIANGYDGIRYSFIDVVGADHVVVLNRSSLILDGPPRVLGPVDNVNVRNANMDYENLFGGR